MPVLKTRLERLESSTQYQEPKVMAITYVEPDGTPSPVSGYSFGDEQLFKEEGETAEELYDRACAAIRAQAPSDARVLVLKPILEDEPRDT